MPLTESAVEYKILQVVACSIMIVSALKKEYFREIEKNIRHWQFDKVAYLNGDRWQMSQHDPIVPAVADKV